MRSVRISQVVTQNNTIQLYQVHPQLNFPLRAKKAHIYSFSYSSLPYQHKVFNQLTRNTCFLTRFFFGIVVIDEIRIEKVNYATPNSKLLIIVTFGTLSLNFPPKKKVLERTKKLFMVFCIGDPRGRGRLKFKSTVQEKKIYNR